MPNNLSIGQLYGPGTAMPANPSIHGGMDLDMIYEINHRNRVLIIDDDPDMVGLLKEILRAAGFDVIGAYGCNEALKKCSDFPPHIILLDLMMPDIDGWATFQYLREITAAPVMVISAITDKDDIVRTLQAGVDDYMTKPFYSAEVIARINSVLRRSKAREQPLQYAFPEVELAINLENKEVVIRNQTVRLTPREYSVLVVLAKRAPRSVSYETITREVWGEDSPNARKRIKYIVYLLRRKLERNPGKPVLILNNEITGYQLNVKQH